MANSDTNTVEGRTVSKESAATESTEVGSVEEKNAASGSPTDSEQTAEEGGRKRASTSSPNDVHLMEKSAAMKEGEHQKAAKKPESNVQQSAQEQEKQNPGVRRI